MRTVAIIAGPTAGGKSALALDRALRLNGVIINADALQMYRDLPILTATPAADDLSAVPHRLYGTLGPNDMSSAPLWRDLALQEIRAALAAGKTPILVGGTGFYLRTMIEGLSPIPEIPDEVREAAEEKMNAIGAPAFHADFAQIDPVMAARLKPGDTQRLIRAWEVLAHTGQSLSVWQSLPKTPPPDDLVFDITLVMPDRETLYDRCDRRFDTMLKSGALEQVRDFAAALGDNDPKTVPVTRALGFLPLREHLRGELTFAEAVEKSKADTRHYAKRQVTWFRNQTRPLKNIASIQTVG